MRHIALLPLWREREGLSVSGACGLPLIDRQYAQVEIKRGLYCPRLPAVRLPTVRFGSKGRPSGAADLGLFNPHVWTSEACRTTSEKCHKPTSGNERAAQKAALAYKCDITSTCKYQSGDYSLETFPL